MSQFAVDDFTVQEISASYVTGTSGFFKGFRFSFPFASQVLEIIKLRISKEHDALWEGNTL